MIKKIQNYFILDTEATTYSFHILPSGHLEQLYYGRRINLDLGTDPIMEKVKYIGGNQIAYSKEHPGVALEDRRLMVSSFGKGDIREPFIIITHWDGAATSDFIYRDYKIYPGKKELLSLPSAYGEKEEVISLEIELFDRSYGITLTLIFTVFYKSNVITRSAVVSNTGSGDIRLERLMSGQLDLDPEQYIATTFRGAWAREMEQVKVELKQGIYISDSKTGTSSNRSNPFFMISTQETTEDYGDCFGFNLIYSGNHYAVMERNSMGKLRILNGIQPANFTFLLKPGEHFEAPEAVMTYSHLGFTGMSHNMHQFIRKHIVRGEWKYKTRPVLLNSWEANYFKFEEGKLLKQAKAAKELGIELFVLDDGWFGNRNDDTSSLGDWYENKKKLPNGLKGLSEKIHAIGMDFGIWVEPEMINENSDCYRKHPDWVVQIPGTEHSVGRNQMLLDLAKKEVADYVIEEMSRVFSLGNINYVKWDMNRIFSDCYSTSLAQDRQKEFSHRYIMGLYHIMKVLTERFPSILFESCASGGNRFDLGMLCYMPQTWASDNTDAVSRVKIQTGYSYGYPMSVMGAHVSGSPNHQTLRCTPLETRFEVAAFGLLGFELNILELQKEEFQAVKEQIEFYKKHRATLQFGEFYRIKQMETSPGTYQWLTVSEDRSKAVGLLFRREAIPNLTFETFRTKGLIDNKEYRFTNRVKDINIKEFGDLINMISPIHIKKDSLLHNLIARFKKLPGEKEEAVAFGDVFNHAGVKLKQAFGGLGHDEDIRVFSDYATRIYLFEEI